MALFCGKTLLFPVGIRKKPQKGHSGLFARTAQKAFSFRQARAKNAQKNPFLRGFFAHFCTVVGSRVCTRLAVILAKITARFFRPDPGQSHALRASFLRFYLILKNRKNRVPVFAPSLFNFPHFLSKNARFIEAMRRPVWPLSGFFDLQKRSKKRAFSGFLSGQVARHLGVITGKLLTTGQIGQLF